MPRNIVCPRHGKFNMHCGCTNKQINDTLKQALQRPEVGSTDGIDALRKDIAAQVTIKERVMKDVRTSLRESERMQAQLVILKWVDSRLESASNKKAQPLRGG